MIARTLDACDIPGMIALSASVGWDYAAPEIETALAAGTLYGIGGPMGLAACAGIFPYGDRLASLGLVIVHPDAQGRGLGRRVTEACLEEAADRCVTLVATEAGEPLYARLGFRTVGTLHKLLAPSWRPAAVPPGATAAPPDAAVPPDRTPMPAGRDASPAAPTALPAGLERPDAPTHEALAARDAHAIGAERARFMRARRAQAADLAWTHDARGALTGFALAVQGPLVRVIGPVVAPDPAAAFALVARLAGRHAGRLRIDVPSQHLGLVAALEAHGFVLERVCPVMALRAERAPRPDGTCFAIAAQAWG